MMGIPLILGLLMEWSFTLLTKNPLFGKYSQITKEMKL